jgi:hypothetical protein
MFSKIIAALALLDNRAQRKERWALEAAKRGEGDWRYCRCRLCSEVREGIYVLYEPTVEDPRITEYRNFLAQMEGADG